MISHGFNIEFYLRFLASILENSGNVIVWLCKRSIESISHLIGKCDQANIIWDGVRQWVRNKVGLDFKIIGY